VDVGFGVVLGTILRWVYEAIKRSLHLSDISAAWGIMIISLLVAIGYNVVTGGFAGLTFDVTDPLKCLEAITAAWTAVYATASAWYPLTKKREK